MDTHTNGNGNMIFPYGYPHTDIHMWIPTGENPIPIPIPSPYGDYHTHGNPARYPPICYAAFDDLRTLFKADNFSIIKRAPKLTSKACWPSQLERQNVNLALRIFHESTVSCRSF